MTRIILLTFVLLATACATATIPTSTLALHPKIEGTEQWFNSDKTFRLRHAGAITIGNEVIPINGFMELDMQRQSAKVAILTGFGIKLANLVVNHSSAQIFDTSPIADQIPHFKSQCILSIRRMFLTDFPQANVIYTQSATHEFTALTRNGILSSLVDQPTGFVREKNFVSTEENWIVLYEGTVTIDGIQLPRQTTFFSSDKDYSVTLQLKNPDIP